MQSIRYALEEVLRALESNSGLRTALIKQLRRVLGPKLQIVILSEIVTMCSHCGMLRKPDVDGAKQDHWVKIKEDPTANSQLLVELGFDISHGICPCCREKYYPKDSD